MTRNTSVISCGNVKIGGQNPVVIQSMTNTETKDVQATVDQIKRLQNAGCEIVRVAVPDVESAQAIPGIKGLIEIPLIADIHFDHKLAIMAIENGADGVRINPGNIGSMEKVDQIIEAAKEKNVKIRIGVNGGSLEKDILSKHKKPTADALVESCMRHVDHFEKRGFSNIVLSLKSSDINTCIDAYEKISKKTSYPLHVGITEAGSIKSGTIKSSIGIGYLLLRGIGDTIRVSLTGDPCEEIFVARKILGSIGLLKEEVKVISCPTCARTKIGVEKIVNQVEKKVQNIKKDITIAIMGCAVNGPGEAREADIGIAGGCGEGLIFKKGEVVRKVKDENLVDELMKELEEYKA